MGGSNLSVSLGAAGQMPSGAVPRMRHSVKALTPPTMRLGGTWGGLWVLLLALPGGNGGGGFVLATSACGAGGEDVRVIAAPQVFKMWQSRSMRSAAKCLSLIHI